MTDIRPIREDEAEEFLRILAGAFKVDFERAYRPFHEEPYFDLRNKWALFQGQEMISILTVTPLTFGWGSAVGIAGVATRTGRQNEGFAGRLMTRVLDRLARNGTPAALLFAQRPELYERAGFEPLDVVVRAPLPNLRPEILDDEMPAALVRAMYDEWADGSPDRLRRDDLRWRFWHWNRRLAGVAGDGYLCHEHGTLREAVGVTAADPLPLPEGTEWLGLSAIADDLGFVFERAAIELTLMGRSVPGQPRLFLTDQF